MKKKMFLFFFFYVMFCQAQNNSNLLEDIINYENVEIKPYFKNGNENFMKYINHNISFIQEEDEVLSGQIEISFIINIDGTICDVLIIKDLGSGTGEEVKRVLLKSPKWEPGFQNEKPVRVLIKLPIIIRVN